MPPHPAATYTIANPNLDPTASPIKLETFHPNTCSPFKYLVAITLIFYLIGTIDLCVRGMVRTWKGAMRYIGLCEETTEGRSKDAVEEKVVKENESVSKNN